MSAAPAPDLSAILAILRAQAPALEAAHGVRILGVFGSFARGEAGSDSDVDVLARITGQPALHDLIAVEDKLATALGRSIDLAFEDAIRPHWAQLILRDLAPA
jgi:uncharacterized protein